MPALTPEAQARAAARAQARRERGIADGPEDLALNERCLQWSTAGPPMLPGVYNNNVQFVQTRDYVVIVNEMIHDARIVPMDGRPHGAVPRWMGDSRGRWEGATLVVDTVGFTDKTSFRGSTITCTWSSASRASTPTRSSIGSPSRIRPSGRGRGRALFPMTRTDGPMLRIRVPRRQRAQHGRDPEGRANPGHDSLIHCAKTSRP